MHQEEEVIGRSVVEESSCNSMTLGRFVYLQSTDSENLPGVGIF